MELRSGRSPAQDAAGTGRERSPLARGLYLSAGWVALGLGIAGVPLPLLPTTPFLILAAACFLRSSPRLHARLLAHPRLGPYLAQWQRERSIPARAKRRAYGLVVVTFAVSIVLVDGTLLRVGLAALGLGLLGFLAALRTGAEPGDGRATDAEATGS